MTPRVQYIFLELPNSLDKALRPGATVLDNFCYALHQMEHLTERPAQLKQEIFQLLFDSAEITNFTAEEKSKYEHDMTTERDIRNYIAYARKEGREEGRAEGAREKALETARAFLALGIAAQTVAEGTGLTLEEVKALAGK